MKKIILALLLLTACNSPVTVQSPVVVPTPVATETLQTYKYLPYSFEFKYPSDFAFGNAQYGQLDEKIVDLEMQNTAYPGTNFVDAAVSVSVGYFQKSDACLVPDSQNFQDKSDVTINDITFTKWTEIGAAAGSKYEQRVYRSYRDKSCFELRETLHTGNIYNYDPGTVTEIDEKPIWQKLDDVVSSFTFYSL